MSKRIYVGNLPFNASEQEIRALVGRHGKVVSVEISRGTATIVMADDASADRAISALKQTRMGGSSLNVNEARPRQD